MATGISIAIVTSSFVNSTYGYRLSQQSESVALAGVEDALLQLARNNQLNNTSGYSLSVGSSTATVTVTQSSPSAGFTTILSQATVSQQTRKIKVIVSVNATTGQPSVVSWSAVQ